MWPGSGKIDRVHLVRKGGREISFLSAAWVVWIWNNQQLSDPLQGNYLTKGHQAHLFSSLLLNVISDEFVKNLLPCTWLEFVVHLTSNRWNINSVWRSFIFILSQAENRNLKKEISKRTKEKPLTTSGWFQTRSMKHNNLLFLIQNALLGYVHIPIIVFTSQGHNTLSQVSSESSCFTVVFTNYM